MFSIVNGIINRSSYSPACDEMQLACVAHYKG